MTKNTQGSEWEKHGRRKPYTSIGISRLPCFRCGETAFHQWQICADNSLYRPICSECDIELNELVLHWFGFNFTEVVSKIEKYKESYGQT